MCQVEHYTPEDPETGEPKAGTPDAVRHVGKQIAASPEYEVYENPATEDHVATICLHRAGVRAPVAEVPVIVAEAPVRASRRKRDEE
jgi:hypothetical protein